MDAERNDDDDGNNTKNINGNRLCKNCAKVELCVLSTKKNPGVRVSLNLLAALVV